MFWNKKKSTANEIRVSQQNQLVNAIQKLSDGDKSYIHIVYSALAFDDPDMVKSAGYTIGKLLEGYSLSQMIALSDTFRQYTSLEWSINWRYIKLRNIKSQFATEKDYVYSLALGSFHPNGYFRESCTNELFKYQDTLAYIILRMNDWVQNIRDLAVSLILKKVETCSVTELFISSLALEKVKRSERRDDKYLIQIQESICKKIEKEIINKPINKIHKYEFDIRKSIYKLIFSKQMLGLEEANILLLQEKNSYCKSVIITGILKNYECSMEQIDEYLKYQNSYVRFMALNYKYAKLNDAWINIEDMLLDQNNRIRELVFYIIRKHSNMNVLNYYIDHLKDINPSIAIVGIGERGNRESVALLLPFLNHKEEKIIKFTILSLGKLMGYDGYDLYWKNLIDKRACVSKAAYQSIRINSIHYSAEKLYNEYSVSEIPHVKRYLVLLIMQENSWDRLPYLLYLLNDTNLLELNDKIRMKIIQRDMYGQLPQTKADMINLVLREKEDILPKGLSDQIKFDLKFLVKAE